jgi:lipopolysaccharide export system permease protein
VKILSRYVLKEHLGPLTFALTALTSLLLLNYIAKQFGNLVGKGIPWTAVAEFFLLSIPFTVALTLPMAVLVATLHAFSRLAAENEITALKASGVSLKRLMTPVLIAAAGITVLMIIFNDQILPRTNHQLAVLQSDIAQKKPTFALREQVINEVSPGKLFLRANHLDEASNLMRDVTIYDLSDATRRRTIYADSGNMALAKNQSDLLLTLYNGSMQDVPVLNPSQLQRLFFNVDLVTVKGVANQFQKSTDAQNKGNREMSVCEMQREVSRGRAEYMEARKDFLNGMKQARDNKVKLSPDLYATDTHVPSNISLGAAYCWVLKELRIPTLSAQGAPALRAEPQTSDATNAQQVGQKTLPAHQSAAPQSAAPQSAAPQSAAPQSAAPQSAAPQSPARQSPAPQLPSSPPPASAPPASSPVTPAGAATTPQTVSTPPVKPVPARIYTTPPPSAGMESTPSTISVAKVRLADAKLKIDGFEIEIHKKFALAVACFVFVMLGAPIALRFPRGGVGLTLGVSLFVFALYYIGLTAGAAAASQGLLPPVIAMWAANVIFAAVAVVLMWRMGKEGATARGGDMREMLGNAREWVKQRMRVAHLLRERRTEP